MPKNASSEKTIYDVFLSYSHADADLYGKEIIQSIKEGIEADLFDITCRHLVFLDSEELHCGDNWHAKIMEKLNECRVFICLLSENYFQSTYCTRERLWWENVEIRRGRLRQDTLPVYFINLDGDPFLDKRQRVRDMFGFQMDSEPWFGGGREAVKEHYLKDRIDNLKKTVKGKLSCAEIAERSFNNVFPMPSRNFVGRILELKELREICANNRYPVIEGAGGVGKSELATVYSYGYASEYPQGRFLIRMEGKKNWEDAILSLIQNAAVDPKTGTNAENELGITVGDLPDNPKDYEKRRNLHSLIIDRLFARAADGRLLLVLDNVDDASLFHEREFLNFSQNRPVPDNIKIIATTRHELVFPENSRAKAYHLNNLDDDASFELFCEIGRNRFPFCGKPVLDRTTDPEYAAAMEIVHLLEGHVWSMEIIAGQLADKYDDGVTFRKKLDSLKKNLSIKDKGQSYRSAAKNPADLLRSTLNLLKEKENGEVIVQLAFFAALLPPDGEKRDVLHVCWDRLFADVAFEDEDADAFLYAYNHLWRYNLLHSRDDDKMHRLTRVALKEIMKTDGAFDDCLRKFTDVMAGTVSIDNETWIDTIAASPEIAPHLKQEHPEFFSVLLTSEAWVKLLSANPSHVRLIESCPWDALNGRDWENLLKEHPRFAEKCIWDKLDGEDWSWLLQSQPQFADKCPWDELSGKDWELLLSVQPQFADKCPWNELSRSDWGWLLRNQPQFADKCPWDELSEYNWVTILEKQPQFADKCPWDKLNDFDWDLLLKEQPQFIKYFTRDRWGGSAWSKLLIKHPEHADKCPWDKLDSNDWVWLLISQPQFADMCPWDKLAGFKLVRILSRQPKIAELFPWDRLSGSDWSNLLCEQSYRLILNEPIQFADKCPWDKLGSEDWGNLLSVLPQFADKCPWDKLDGTGWRILLRSQPQFADKCPWDKLDSFDLEIIVGRQPQLADKCPLDKLNGFNWANILRNNPALVDRIQWDRMTGFDWAGLLSYFPQFADKCPWDLLDNEDWAWLLIWHPQFADKCGRNKLDGNEWHDLYLQVQSSNKYGALLEWMCEDPIDEMNLWKKQPPLDPKKELSEKPDCQDPFSIQETHCQSDSEPISAFAVLLHRFWKKLTRRFFPKT